MPNNYAKEASALAIKNNFLYITGIYRNINKCEINKTTGELLNCGETESKANEYITSMEIAQNNIILIDSKLSDIHICPFNNINSSLEKCKYFFHLQSANAIAIKGKFAYFILHKKTIL